MSHGAFTLSPEVIAASDDATSSSSATESPRTGQNRVSGSTHPRRMQESRTRRDGADETFTMTTHQSFRIAASSLTSTIYRHRQQAEEGNEGRPLPSLATQLGYHQRSHRRASHRWTRPAQQKSALVGTCAPRETGRARAPLRE